jgi:hypothetical protein
VRRRKPPNKLKMTTTFRAGSDPITARFMRQDFFTYIPQFKLVVAGNHRPAIRNVDEAAKRRLNMVPFTITVPPQTRDKQLKERLCAERDGILAWAIDGCLEWQRIGLVPPPAVVKATEEYFAQEDAIGRWLEECCTCGRANDVTSVIDLFQCWTAWTKVSNEFQGSKRRFSITLEERGFQRMHGEKGSSFQRIRLSEEGIAFIAHGLGGHFAWLTELTHLLNRAYRSDPFSARAYVRLRTICQTRQDCPPALAIRLAPRPATRRSARLAGSMCVISPKNSVPAQPSASSNPSSRRRRSDLYKVVKDALNGIFGKVQQHSGKWYTLADPSEIANTRVRSPGG